MGGESEQPDDRVNRYRDINEYVRAAKPPPAELLELEFVFEALAHARRRYVIYSLLSSTRWTLMKLATKLAAWERHISEADVASSARDEMYVSLYHTHIPKLIELDIIRIEEGDGEVIVAAENAVQVLAVLEGAGSSLDAAQETHARGETDKE